jgi:hypothetical protein
MEEIINEYGQAIVAIIFGGSVISLLGWLLEWITSNGVIA